MKAMTGLLLSLLDEDSMNLLNEMVEDHLKTETQMQEQQELTPEQKKQENKLKRMNEKNTEKSRQAQAAIKRKKEKLRAENQKREDLHKQIEENGPKRFVLTNGGIGAAVRHPYFKKGGFKNALRVSQYAAAKAAALSRLEETKPTIEGVVEHPPQETEEALEATETL
jgi:predicted phage gp36 major capsid-like protein